MTFFSKAFIKIKEIRSRLTKISDSEPLSWLSIFFVLALDLFVLINIFSGLQNQTELLVSPTEYFPAVCRSIIIDENWVDENRIVKLSSVVLDKYRATNYEEEFHKKRHPISTEILNSLKEMNSDKSIIQQFRQIDKFRKEYNSYDLYEKSYSQDTQLYLNEIENIADSLNNNPKIIKFWKIIERSTKNRDDYIEDLRWFNFHYPIRKLLIEFLFLIPILLILFYWFNLSVRKNRNLQTFISSHLIVVTAIPTFIEICHCVFSIIPKKMIQTIFELLRKYNIISIWHYVLIIFSVLFTLLIIYFIQKKLFTKQLLLNKRISKEQCIFCGKKLPESFDFCPFCGEHQKEECAKCKEKTFVGTQFCEKCGYDRFE